ncbi:hypothetical protein [Thermaurantiacus sp.]
MSNESMRPEQAAWLAQEVLRILARDCPELEGERLAFAAAASAAMLTAHGCFDPVTVPAGPLN